MPLQYKKYLKILCKTLIVSVFIYLVLVILEYARQGFINDLSMQKVDLSLQNSIKEPVYLVSMLTVRSIFIGIRMQQVIMRLIKV